MSDAMKVKLLVALLWTVAGCTDPPPAPGTSAPSPARQAGLRELRELDVVSGVLPVQAVGEGELALWASGREVGRARGDPARFSWDTTAAPDGLIELVLKHGAREIDRARVVVLNRGAEVFFKNGSSGKVEVPPGGYRHQHLRYHWDQGEGRRRVLAILTWDRPGFEMELALGRGTCPHHGERMAVARGTRSPLVLEHRAPGAATLPVGQWFAHVEPLNADRLAGQHTAFEVRAYALEE